MACDRSGQLARFIKPKQSHSGGRNVTSALPTYHAAFLAEACGILSADRRIHTLLAGGSMIHGGMDEFSDLDLVVVVEEEFYTEVLASRMEIARGVGPL